MSKQYELVGAKTYGTLTQIFRAGVRYSEEEVSKVIDDANDEGQKYFAEAGAVTAETGGSKDQDQKKNVLIVGKKGDLKKSADDKGGDSGKGNGSTVVTV